MVFVTYHLTFVFLYFLFMNFVCFLILLAQLLLVFWFFFPFFHELFVSHSLLILLFCCVSCKLNNLIFYVFIFCFTLSFFSWFVLHDAYFLFLYLRFYFSNYFILILCFIHFCLFSWFFALVLIFFSYYLCYLLHFQLIVSGFYFWYFVYSTLHSICIFVWFYLFPCSVSMLILLIYFTLFVVLSIFTHCDTSIVFFISVLFCILNWNYGGEL